MLTDKQFNLKEKRTELENRIQICKDSKLKINEFVRNLKWQYFSKKITYENYCKQLKSVLRERSLEQWTKYYNDSIEYYERELKKLDNKRSINAIGIVLLLLIISGIGLFYLNSNITGFAIGENLTDNMTIAENLNVIENLTTLENLTIINESEIINETEMIYETGVIEETSEEPDVESNGEYSAAAFMGSGTTAVACKETKRKFIGFELNPDYIKIAEKRLSQEQLNTDWFEN